LFKWCLNGDGGKKIVVKDELEAAQNHNVKSQQV
jgi:hypothetical protein